MADRKPILDNPQATFVNTKFDPNSFCGRKREVVFQNTLLYQLKVLKDTGRYDAFKLKWHPSYSDEPDVPPIPNHLFWDSDVAKWIEGACYFLQSRQHAEIEAAVHELVAMIQSAQQPDGYLNIHFTVVEPTKRFTNLRDLHELYNAGHLIEAALAHEQLFHTGALLRPLERYVDLLHAVLGPAPPQLRGYPGHPEIELALLRLHKATGSPKALALARFFLDERGRPDGVDGRHFYDAGVQRDGPVEAIRMVYVCLLPTECGEVAGKVSVNVHMYGSATLTVPVGDSAVTVKQESEWPYDGKIGFEVKAPEGIEVDVKLRIPSWASEWQVSPDLPADLDIVALARGPIVYCVEDVDNPWDDDHFKSLIFDPASKITETLETDPTTNEKYVSLTAHDGVSFLKTPDHLAMPEASSTAEAGQPGKTLKFVPYYFRANRGGKGHMRVGLRRKSS
ncbi:putative duf1680 domain protein [Neofusicoccum parvum UCRNP2]|uniref:Putative duf1680 domain protein n=1 Tax=Botryosphaeria parva (strain UCR-NP2) TaxID=1287680 RepID=R1EPN7_BOTPV|nr:putative duf1680 domain protein [Neofusicoccum parvum UCRNP2]